MDRAEFQEALLQIMERKVHWAWPAFTDGLVPKAKLHIHLEQEYATYVRDFPVLIGRAYIQCPIPEVRRELAENLYEEETGGLSGGRPHPELFLEYPRGLGMDLERFGQVELLPKAAAFRAVIDDATTGRGWEIAAAVTTLFLEGTPYERGELEEDAAKRPLTRLSEHPLVRHYGLPVEHLALTKAHRQIEGEHRQSAWHILLRFVAEDARQPVLDWMAKSLAAWLGYRDEVAGACDIEHGADGRPVRLAS